MRTENLVKIRLLLAELQAIEKGSRFFWPTLYMVTHEKHLLPYTALVEVLPW